MYETFIPPPPPPPAFFSTEVRTQSVGVYTFPKTDADSATCVTDVLIDPSEVKDPSSSPPRHDACIQVG